MERKLVAILAADAVGYSRLMEQHEVETFERLRAHRKQLFEPEIARHHGQIFKLMGDGLLAEFGSVVDAVECAVVLQREMAERNSGLRDDQAIQIRIGAHVGDVIVEGDDRHGDAVNIAARLQQLAEPGGICVSRAVVDNVKHKVALGFDLRGQERLKNISEPISIYSVKLDSTSMGRIRQRKSLVYGLGAVLIASIIAVAGLSFSFMRSEIPPAPIHSANVPSIAVLPFDDLSANKSLEYFGDGVSEDIITMLSRFPDLAVVGRNSSFNYKGKPLRQIGKELAVDYVLEGSVRKEGNQVRIVAQLINARNDEHVWAERFDKMGTDPWELQDEVTGKIVSAMTGEKGAIKQADYRQSWGKDETNIAEYDYYLRGHEQLMKFTEEGIERAGEIWREGLAKFPLSSLLTVKLGWYHEARALNFFSDNPPADHGKAGELVRQVLANEHLPPQVARLAHWLMAYVLLHERDFDGAIAQAEKAIALAPYDTFVLCDLSGLLIQSGRPEQALEWTDKAAARDPALAWFYHYVRGMALLALGKYDDAIHPLKQTDAFDSPLLLAIAYVRLDRLTDAHTEVEKMVRNNPAITQELWRQGLSYRDSTILDRHVAALAQAGLPAK